jgi:hypothetical protein
MDDCVGRCPCSYSIPERRQPPNLRPDYTALTAAPGSDPRAHYEQSPSLFWDHARRARLPNGRLASERLVAGVRCTLPADQSIDRGLLHDSVTVSVTQPVRLVWS